MAARSNRQLTNAPETSALEMRWVSQGGQLRSRWNATPQQNHFEHVSVAPRLKVVSRGTTSAKAEIAWLVGLVCFLVAFVL